MTITKRIIPRLEIKNDNLVKGINLEGLRVIGKPDFFAKNYYHDGADELLYQDVVASLYGKNSLQQVIEKTAKNIFIPLTVGGGIRNLNDISRLLKCGADKVAINSAAIKNPKFISKASEKYGKSTIVLSIETQFIESDYYVLYENGRNNSNIKLLDWIKRIQKLGAGEIIVIFVENEGTYRGFNLEIIKKIQSIVNIPLVICGGMGKKSHAFDILTLEKVSGLAMSSILHYDLLKKSQLNNNLFKIGNTDFLLNKNYQNKFQTTNIISLKKYLYKKNININL